MLNATVLSFCKIGVENPSTVLQNIGRGADLVKGAGLLRKKKTPLALQIDLSLLIKSFKSFFEERRSLARECKGLVSKSIEALSQEKIPQDSPISSEQRSGLDYFLEQCALVSVAALATLRSLTFRRGVE